MRISDLRAVSHGRSSRISARVEWEESERPILDLFFETDDCRAEDFRADSNAFLLACALPAMRHGEKRIAVEGAVCPVLRDGIATAVRLLRDWYGPPRILPPIEPTLGFAPSVPGPARSALVYSGGIDSLHLLRANRRDVPAGHAASFKDALWITAHDSPAPATARLREALSRPLAQTGVELLAVSTNVRSLETDLEFFAREFFLAALISAAHLFRRRFRSISVASTAPAGRLLPWGSHPLLDPLFGTAALDVRHERLGTARLQKVREVATRAIDLRALHVCNEDPPPGFLNCGECEKCVETMSELIAVGRPGPWPSFPPDALAPASIAALPVLQDTAAGWEELPTPLEAAGRPDLAAAIRKKLLERERVRRWEQGKNWSGWIRRADRRRFGGRLSRLYRGLIRR